MAEGLFARVGADVRSSFPQQRCDLAVDGLERHEAFVHLAIDEEGRRCPDLHDLEGNFLIDGDFVEQGLILQASFDPLFAHAVLSAGPLQGICGLRDKLILLSEQVVDGAKISQGIVVGDGARQH